jgi:hypothetical protein
MSPKRFAGMLLLPVLLGAAALLAGIVGCAIMPVIVAFRHGGWSDIFALPRQSGVFLLPPEWLRAQNASAYGLVRAGGGFVSLALSVVTLVQASHLWAHLAVTKWKLMTRQEAEEFGKRDPGF